MARLDPITFKTGVRPLALSNPYGPLSKARKRVAAAGMVGKAAESTSEIADDIYQRKIQMDIENAQSAMIEGETATLGTHKDKLEYNIEEVPPDMVGDADFGPGGRPIDKPIPGYEVKPEVMRAERMQSLENALSGIDDADARETFKNATEKNIAFQYQRDMLNAQQEQKVVHRSNQQSMIEKFLQQGRYDAADMIAQNYEGTQKEKDAFKFGIQKQREVDPMSLSIAQKDVPVMEAQLMVMRSDPDDYEGTLTQAERTAWAGKLERAIWQTGKQARENRSANDKIITHTVKRLTDALYDGYDIPQERIQEVGELSKSHSNNAPLLGLSILEASRFQKHSAQIASVPPSVRTNLILSTRADAATDENAAVYHARMADAVDSMNREQAEDSMSFGIKTGQVEAVGLDSNNLADSLTKMNKNDLILQGSIASTTGLFTKAQANDFANIISRMTPDQLMQTFSTIEASVGDRSFVVYEQLKAEGLADTLPIAGQIAAEGGITASREVIEGRRIRKNYPKMFKFIEAQLDEMISEELGFAYKDKEGQHELMKEAIKDVYATTITKDSTPELLDTNKLETAVTTVTGGLIEQDGERIEAPYRNFGQKKWDDYVGRIKPSAIARMGVPKNFTPRELLTDIRDEKVEFHNAGKNEYYLFHTLSNDYVQDKRGGAFVFRYLDNTELEPTFMDKAKGVLERFRTSDPGKEEILEGAKKRVMGRAVNPLDTEGEEGRSGAAAVAAKRMIESGMESFHESGSKTGVARQIDQFEKTQGRPKF